MIHVDLIDTEARETLASGTIHATRHAITLAKQWARIAGPCTYEVWGANTFALYPVGQCIALLITKE
jgi:hypothetical protein